MVEGDPAAFLAALRASPAFDFVRDPLGSSIAYPRPTPRRTWYAARVTSMGASILVHWPEATEEDEEGHPGFSNDDHAWASWLVAVIENPSAAQLVKRLGVDALLSHTTEGADADAIQWTTPDELERAALALRELVVRADPEV